MPGKYQNGTGATACRSCSQGYYCEEGAAAELPCGAGRYSAITGLGRASACLQSPPGSFAVAGSAAFIECSAGSFAEGFVNGLCSTCPVNYYAEDAGATACANCPPGTRCPEGSSTPLPASCARGHYIFDMTSYVNASSCDTCPSGHFCFGGAAQVGQLIYLTRPHVHPAAPHPPYRISHPESQLFKSQTPSHISHQNTPDLLHSRSFAASALLLRALACLVVTAVRRGRIRTRWARRAVCRAKEVTIAPKAPQLQFRARAAVIVTAPPLLLLTSASRWVSGSGPPPVPLRRIAASPASTVRRHQSNPPVGQASSIPSSTGLHNAQP